MRHAFSSVASARGVLALTILSCFAFPSRGVAQRMSCSRAQTTLLNKNSTRDELQLAMAKMVNCGDAAPAGSVKMLRQVTSRSTADTIAITGAWALLDRRLVDSIGVLALDASQPRERRLVFLRLLTRYVAPSAGIDTSEVNYQVPSVLTSMQDSEGVIGTNPITFDGRNVARARIQSMSIHDADTTLRKLAALVYQELQADYPQ